MPYSEDKVFEKDEYGYYNCPFCGKRYIRYPSFFAHLEKHLDDLLRKLEFIGKS